MRLIFLFILLFSSKAIAVEVKASELYYLYLQKQEQTTYEGVKGYFSSGFLNTLKSDLKQKCGIRCVFGLNDEWLEKYKRVLLVKTLKYVKSYSITETEFGVQLNLTFTSCVSFGDNSTITYIYENGGWRINSKEASVNIETSDEKLKELQHSKGCKYQRSLGL